jgi:hypothetical protein
MLVGPPAALPRENGDPDTVDKVPVPLTWSLSTALLEGSANIRKCPRLAMLPELAGPLAAGSAVSAPDVVMENGRIWFDVVVA